MVTDNNDLLSSCLSHTSESLNTPEEESLSVSLLYSKVTRQVLCIEAGKEFVDLLLGFLTLPLGCIIKLLAEGSLLEPQEASSADERPGVVGSISTQSVSSSNSKDERVQREKKEVGPLSSIANVYDSVVKMDDAYLSLEKTVLLDPRPVTMFGGKLLPVSPMKVKKEVVIEFYCCGVACNFISAKQGVKCPRHKRKMETPCKTVDDEAELQGQSTDAGHVKEGQFVITNNLEIYPSSAIKSLMHLNMLKSERVSDLDNLEILVGTEEVHMLVSNLSVQQIMNTDRMTNHYRYNSACATVQIHSWLKDRSLVTEVITTYSALLNKADLY